MTQIILNLNPFIQLSDEQFYQLCQNHRDSKFERTVQGELVIVPLVGEEGESWKADLIRELMYWNRQSQLVKGFNSLTCFRPPEGGNHSLDAAWASSEQWNQLTPKQQKKLSLLHPDFLIELPSENNALEPSRQKMQEYLNNGLRLGWLINLQKRQVEIYRTNQIKQVLEDPKQLSGENVFPGFVLDLSTLWGKSWHFSMGFRNILQLLFAPTALEKESLEWRNNIQADTVKKNIEDKRKGLFSTLSWIFIPAALGVIAAQLLNHVYIIPSNFVPYIRTFSLSIFAFATLSRLEEARTFDGNSLPEKTNTFLFKLFYGFGFSLTIATLFLAID
ncbi:Uma2 family endonuclease [Oculatella sp. FACHB-28]|uniref:Uma2 family endonuclease n=1 Tax=Oculatella sp. FACHB-28 TaxID=2692845 RepID=UPI001689D093|nr:Uma2 family endonuclease [Oculatella sp. FACHB-28]